MSEYVAGFLFQEDYSQVALVRKKRPTWQKGFLNAIGGLVERGETLHQAMVREFEEETGLRVDDWKGVCCLEGKTLNDDGSFEKQYNLFRVYFFAAKIVNPHFQLKGLKPVNDEVVKVYPVAHTSDRLPNLRWLVPMAISALEGLDRALYFNVDERY